MTPAQGLATHRLAVDGRSLAIRALSELAAGQLAYGRPDGACGRAMVAYIEWACDRCLAGEAAAMVTAPINKAAIRAAGSPFPGHTELLAKRCGVDKVVMMLAGERLKVALVTTHMALVDVPAALTAAEILATIRITAASLRRFFGRTDPRLAVLALNPHAGEGGHFGERGGARDPAGHRGGPGGRESRPAGRTALIPSFTSPRREPTTPSSACTTIRALSP